MVIVRVYRTFWSKLCRIHVLRSDLVRERLIEYVEYIHTLKRRQDNRIHPRFALGTAAGNRSGIPVGWWGIVGRVFVSNSLSKEHKNLNLFPWDFPGNNKKIKIAKNRNTYVKLKNKVKLDGPNTHNPSHVFWGSTKFWGMYRYTWHRFWRQSWIQYRTLYSRTSYSTAIPSKSLSLHELNNGYTW